MDTNKILKYVLYAVAAMLGVFIINTWNKDYPQTASTNTQTLAASSSHSNRDYLPEPSFPATTTTASSTVAASVSSSPSSVVTPAQTFITVTTDVLSLLINSDNGNIVSAKLLKYPVSVTQKQTPIQILNSDPQNVYASESGLTNSGTQPIHFHATTLHYQLQPDQKTLVVTLKAQTSNGLRVDKVYTFTRGDYAINSAITVENTAPSIWHGVFYHRIIRKNIPVAHPYLQRSSYDGAAISTPSAPYQKLTFKSLAQTRVDQTVANGWVAMQQPYFVTSWIPSASTTNKYYSNADGGDDNGVDTTFTLGYINAEDISLLPGKTITDNAIFYVGPELATQLVKASPSLVGTIDYSWAAPISVVIFWFMQQIFWLVGNWGWTIILITLLIKLVFFPLSDKSYKSMAKMKEAQPRIKAMQERYSGDKQALNKAMMEFYKSEKLNPMSGCLPMIIQIPVFFALYYVLIESVQLRQSPFIFWIHDLSVRDPYFILPLLMGVSMFIQQKLSPPPPDPTQAKVMLFMPIMFTVMFLWFPVGLVLYWLTNNVLSILHQWYILKTFDPKKEKYKQREKKKNKSIKKLG